jgi:hypothetical protein
MIHDSLTRLSGNPYYSIVVSLYLLVFNNPLPQSKSNFAKCVLNMNDASGVSNVRLRQIDGESSDRKFSMEGKVSRVSHCL